EKWFCSNANAEIIFALARTNEDRAGTRGLSIFMIEKTRPDGSPNPLGMVRLKDKLGVRSMASAECKLNNTVGKLVGNEFEGFKVMAEMINLSRLYNSVAALSTARRALVEAFQFLVNRKTFGKKAIEHVLIREKLYELGSLHIANFYLTWKAIETLDAADSGNEEAQELIRFLTPMVKKWSAEKGVYIVRESMELMGGIGYIEDGVMPKLMRDIMVLPIWEGAGNIMILDMLRASQKSNGLAVMLAEIEKSVEESDEHRELMARVLRNLKTKLGSMSSMEGDQLQLTASVLFQKLTTLYQMTVLIQNQTENSKSWIKPALKYLSDLLEPNGEIERSTLSVEEVRCLIAWAI
ncbi:acyl-CoA dehydrogenase, partial [Fulvivirga sp. RKSG066]|uniref:acyl-CoA dehydrogenase family protein n=1 Tax=Fulvivirga aurantia TaxID=2529383 RepID=UPI0024833187